MNIQWLVFAVLCGSVIGALRARGNCTTYIQTTRMGRQVTKTLIYHTHYKCPGNVTGICVQGQTTYIICHTGNKTVCFEYIQQKLPSS